MEAADLSCSKLARMAGCSKSMIGHLRTGKVETCSPSLAAALEIALLPVTERPLFSDHTRVHAP
jgi:transcriptional regulator with XRE-family HTH domain